MNHRDISLLLAGKRQDRLIACDYIESIGAIDLANRLRDDFAFGQDGFWAWRFRTRLPVPFNEASDTDFSLAADDFNRAFACYG